MFGLGGQEFLLLALIVLLLFGASRLPKLARSMREAREEFRRGNDESAGPADQRPAATPPPATPTPAPPVEQPPEKS